MANEMNPTIVMNASQIERVLYWEGQLLASIDLKTQVRVAAELRRQHNRSVHGAYGIAIGLAVSDIADGALPISCGLAYDCSGRELMLAEGRSVALPPAPITVPQLLVIAYDAAQDEASLSWQPQGAPVSSDSVAIARLLPGTPAPSDPTIDPAFRSVVARPMARPQLAAGQTVPGDTAWEIWNEDGVSVGVQSSIDTSAAGFTSTPNYFAEVVSDTVPDFLPAWFVSIADPAPDGFTLRLFMRRITREAFDIVDPKTQVAATPVVGGKVSLISGNVFAKYDSVSRLLPVALNASIVKTLTGTSATIDNPLNPFTAAKQVAFGNPPRIASVTKVPAAANGFQVTVDAPANFQAGNVVAKINGSIAAARPTTVASIDDMGELELANSITGLATGDSLGIAQTPSMVTAVSATTVTVHNPELFAMNDIVVCVDDPVENFPPAKITNITGAANEVLTLTPAVPGLKGLRIAAVQLGGTVQTVDTEAGEVKIQVSQTNLFRAGDLVAKILPGGAFTAPVRVQSIQSSTKTVTLSNTIAGLDLQDQIGSADFRVRSTVLNVSGTTVTVANASLYPPNSVIVRLNDAYTPTATASIDTSLGSTLVLHTAVAGLKAGDIIALCSFPVVVTVQGIGTDGTVQVTPTGLIKTGDVVASPAHPGIAIVASANGPSVQLASSIPGLTVNDTLSVVTVSGTVGVTPGTTTTKVTLDAQNRVRVGDFLGDIVGWREPGPARSIALALDVTGTNLTLSSQIDGLMINDNLGLASIASGGFWLQLRLQSIPDVTPGDEALLVGLDRLQGQTASMFATVEYVLPSLNLVFLAVEGTPGPFTIRPEDLSASILFLRGSPLALVQNQDLYVSWLACQNPDPMPRPCPDGTNPDCPCGKTSNS
jgi:hypothetical protein